MKTTKGKLELQATETDGFLTENTIKKVGLRFLKSYYKYRPRKQREATVASLDMRASGGIIADGFYSYKKPNNSTFLATFEATSYFSKKEILFQPQQLLLMWDSIAMAGVLTAFLYSLSYFYDFWTIKQLGTWMLTGLIFLSFLLISYLFRLLARGFHRYRYIYSVEQFKKYHADEQWVVIGSDVFNNPTDKYLRELKNQCVYNGFGLISVDRRLEPHVLITPSREEVFKGKRKVKQFLGVDSSKNKLKPSASRKLLQKLGLAKASESLGYLSLNRFSRSFYNQLVVFGISLLLIGGIFYKELQDAELVVVDKDDHQIEMFTHSMSTQKEPKEFTVDSNYIKREKKLPQEHHWWDLEGDKSNSGLRKNLKKKQPSKNTPSVIDSLSEYRIEVLLFNENGGYIEYDCARFMNFEENKYIVLDGIYANMDAAKLRMQELNARNLVSNTFWLGCFAEENDQYAVFFDVLYNTEEEALNNMNTLFSKLAAKDLPNNHLEIKKLISKD